jgi:hypothetical protein
MGSYNSFANKVNIPPLGCVFDSYNSVLKGNNLDSEFRFKIDKCEDKD